MKNLQTGSGSDTRKVVDGRSRLKRRAVRSLADSDRDLGGIELQWPNKELRLLSTDDGNIWVSANDSRLAEIRLLTPVQSFGVPEGGLLVHGDAVHALKTLTHLDTYKERTRGKVTLCYIDPPFNTGEDFEHYADSCGSTEWLALFRETLLGIKDLLAPDGSVWVHLDDSEQHRARCVLDEVFGARAFVVTIIWQKRSSRDNRKAFSAMHDYIHVYAPMGPIAWKKRRNALVDNGAFANTDDDPRGPWRSAPMTAQAGHATAGQFYTVVSPTGVSHLPPKGRCWTYTEERFNELVLDNRVYWPRSGQGKPRLKRYQSESDGLAPFTIWQASEVGENAEAKRALMAEFPDSSTFDTPKPVRLLERIIHIGTDPGELVLDCFLGSGTTAVVAAQMGRKWIGVERNVATIERFVVPRLRADIGKRRAEGENRKEGGFNYVEVAPSLFIVDSLHSVKLSSWATGDLLAEAIAIQLGYSIEHDGLFVGRIGRSRLAVHEGIADAKVVMKLVRALRPRQMLDLAATEVDDSALSVMADLGKGHRIRKIPEAIMASYESRAELLELHKNTNVRANAIRSTEVSGE